MASLLVSSLFILIPLITAQSTYYPVKPPAIPLAVRSPYLSTWLPAGLDGGSLAGTWPSFWPGQATGWCGLIRVDNETYTWMGQPDSAPTLVQQTAFEYTSTRSIFSMDVGGKVSMNITFLSPADPQDQLRQSMPVSYLSVNVQSTDGNEHNVVIYTDVSAEWASGNRSQVAEWSRGTARGTSDGRSSDIQYHKFWRQTQQLFSETGDQASWGYWYYVTENGDGVTYQSGSHSDVRGKFIDDGELANTEDDNFRRINDAFPVFGFANDLGSVSSNSIETVFAINLMQERVVQFTTGNGVEQVPALWLDAIGDELEAVTTFYLDYGNAARISADLDSKVASDSRAVGGDDYALLTSLAVRQAFGGAQIAGTLEKSYMFLKEISSNGNFQTVDVVFPFQPILLYMNANWMKLILDPLFINMETPGLWPQDYAIHDIGDHYPNATGHSDGKAALQPLEECGNMLIMTLAYAQKTGDVDYLREHWDSLHKWGQWLITNNSVIPFHQISTDDFAGPLENQTNLALKGIIGLKAASVIANLTGRSDAAARYDNQAHAWIQLWQQLGVNSHASPPHTVLNYGAPDSWSLLYNLYADRLLQTNLVPTQIYQQQSNFYPTVEQRYGVALDTRSVRSKSDWQIFAAAVAGRETREMFVRDVAGWVGETVTRAPVTDLYSVASGDFITHEFKARPVVGGWFALLAVEEVGIPG